jgi:hypothetical protein
VGRLGLTCHSGVLPITSETVCFYLPTNDNLFVLLLVLDKEWDYINHKAVKSFCSRTPECLTLFR